jgi:glycosyltransferase involved in cell wall biosynthesis
MIHTSQNSSSNPEIPSQILDRDRLVNSASLPDPISAQPTIALLPCGDLFEDFFDTIGMSLETFSNELTGGWMFNYIESLELVGIRTILVFFSARVTQPTRLTHLPTGALICVLPPSKPYLLFRATLRQMKAWWKRPSKITEDTISSNPDRSSSNSYTSGAQTSRFRALSMLKSGVGSFGTYISTPLASLAQELKCEGCTAILCQDYEYARFDIAVLLGKLMHLPVFATFQGGDKLPNPFEYPFRWLSLRASDGLIVAPQMERDRLESEYGIVAPKVARIFNPMGVTTWQAIDREEARHYLNIPVDARVAVFHGRMQIQQKGLDLLLEAWEKICQQRPDKDLRLLLVGTGSDAEELSRQIIARRLTGIVWINEYVRDRTAIQRYLSAADVYTLPSRKEGFPVAPLEAMACSLPIVAFDVAGISDILEHGEASGGIVVPREDVDRLALKLGQLLDDEILSRELGKRARKRVEEGFSFETIGQQLQVMLTS